VEDEISRIINVVPGWVRTALQDGNINFVNLCWREYAQLSVNEAYGTGWASAVRPEDFPDLAERWQSLLACGEPNGDYHRFLISNDGPVATFLFSIRRAPESATATVVLVQSGVSFVLTSRAS
jgi:hypothetical protein